MKKLVSMGLLTESRGDGYELRGWVLGPKGRRRYLHGAPDEWAIHERAPSYRTPYRHDQLLRELRSLYATSPIVKKWISEQRLRNETMQKFYYLHSSGKSERVGALPDAILHLSIRGQASIAALELELRQKDKKRLFSKIEAHILHEDFSYIFYVVDGRELMATLLRIYKEVREKSFRVKLARKQNGIFFVDLSEVKRLGLKAKFQGLEHTFSFESLAA